MALPFDISALTLEQKKELFAQVEQEKFNIADELKAEGEKKLKALEAELEQLQKIYGIKAKLYVQAPPKKLKYKNPATGEVWEGAGNPIKWLRLLMEAGHKKEEFLVKDE